MNAGKNAQNNAVQAGVRVFGSTLKSMSTAAKAITNALPEELAQRIDPLTANRRVDEMMLYQMGVAIEDLWSSIFLRTNLCRRISGHRYFLRRLVNGWLLVGGGSSKVALGAARGTAVTTILGAGAGADESFQDAIASGASSEEAMQAAGLGALLGFD